MYNFIMKNDSLNTLEIAHECLLSIGVSLELDSMVLAFTSTFTQQSGAKDVFFYIFKDGVFNCHLCFNGIDFDMSRYQDMQEPTIEYGNEYNYLIIPIFKDRLLFIFDKSFSNDHLEQIAKIIFSFKHRIAIAKSSCINVEKIQNINETLEEKVKEELQKNIQKDALLLTQSKQALMGEMLSMIAHQWRQPLTTIGIMANNLYLDIEMNSLNTDVFKKELNEMNSVVSFLSKTIDNFRNFFKPNKEKSTFSLQELLDSTIVLIKKTTEVYGVHIDLLISQNIQMLSYKNELIQVLLNLIKNAQDVLVEKNISNATIKIATNVIDENILFSICDNGGGISDEIKTKIFEPYFSTKNEKNGTGLGLYMSKSIVEEHLHGQIWFENIDDGVCFYIKIPYK